MGYVNVDPRPTRSGGTWHPTGASTVSFGEVFPILLIMGVSLIYYILRKK